jgi:hypothetical protein
MSYNRLKNSLTQKHKLKNIGLSNAVQGSRAVREIKVD